MISRSWKERTYAHLGISFPGRRAHRGPVRIHGSRRGLGRHREGHFLLLRRPFRRLPGHPSHAMKGAMMNKLDIAGNWNETKGKLRQRFGILTDQDLEFSKGKEEELLGRLE